MSGGFGLPAINFSPLAKLGQEFDQGIREEDKRRAVAAITVAPGQPGFLQQLGQNLLKAGDVDGAVAASRLLSADQDRQFQRETSARDFDFRKQEADRQQGNFTTSLNRQTANDRYDQIYKDRANTRADQSLALQQAQANRKEVPEGFRTSATGGLEPIPGGKADPAYIGSVKAAEEAAKGAGGSVNPYASGTDKFNADQGKSAGFADRMFQNEDLIRKQEAIGTSRVQQGLAKAPFGLGSYANSDEFKSYKAAKDNWIAAQLRKESGAAIGQGEYDAADKQYFPQPGDPPQVLEQKRQLRRLATEGMAREGGGSYAPKMTFGDDGSLKPYTPPARGAGAAVAPAQPGNRVDSIDAIPEGKRFRAPDGKIYRKVNGQAVAE